MAERHLLLLFLAFEINQLNECIFPLNEPSFALGLCVLFFCFCKRPGFIVLEIADLSEFPSLPPQHWGHKPEPPHLVFIFKILFLCM